MKSFLKKKDVQVIWRCRNCNRITLPDLPEKLPKRTDMGNNVLGYPDVCIRCEHTFFHKEWNWIIKERL